MTLEGAYWVLSPAGGYGIGATSPYRSYSDVVATHRNDHANNGSRLFRTGGQGLMVAPNRVMFGDSRREFLFAAVTNRAADLGLMLYQHLVAVGGSNHYPPSGKIDSFSRAV